MISKESVNQIITHYLDNTDYYLVDLNISKDNKISIEIDSFNGVSIDFCAKLNRYIESQLDREIEDYELEVSSAGLTTPFKVIKQYKKNIGNEVEVLTNAGKKLSGILTQVSDDTFSVETETTEKQEGFKRKIIAHKELTFNYSEVKYTKYIIRFK